MVFGRKKKQKDVAVVEANTAATAISEENASRIGRTFIKGLDRAVHLQSGFIKGYVNWLRRSNPEATPAEIQEIMRKHFMNAAAGSGAGAGGAAAVPGVGFVTGSAAIAAESLLFVDMAAVYTVGSAYLRGEDIADAERRRAIVLLALSGAQGAAIVDTLVGPEASALPTTKSLAKFTGPTLTQANNMMTRTVMKSINRRLRRMWIGKIMPLGIGVIAGVTANRALAKKVVENTARNLGPAPAEFAAPLPPKSNEEEKLAEAADGKKTWKSRFQAVMDVFEKNRDDAEETAN